MNPDPDIVFINEQLECIERLLWREALKRRDSLQITAGLNRRKNELLDQLGRITQPSHIVWQRAQMERNYK